MAMIFCSCGSKPTTGYNSKAVDNSFNNLKVGGKLAYIDNNLYVDYIRNIYSMGTFKINNEGIESLYKQAKIQLSLDAPFLRFYPYQGELYAFEYRDVEFKKYNEEKKNFVECEYKIPCNYALFYMSQDLIVHYTSSGNYNLKVNYKNKIKYKIKGVDDYCVRDNVIYYVDDDGYLRKSDVAKKELVYGNKGTLLNYADDYNIYDITTLCGDYIYFYDHERGFVRYSISEDKFEQLMDLKGDFQSMNSYGDMVYVATSKGIFACNNVTARCKKISGIKTEEIYIFDEDWVYTNDNEGNIYRMTSDGKTVEKVKIQVDYSKYTKDINDIPG